MKPTKNISHRIFGFMAALSVCTLAASLLPATTFAANPSDVNVIVEPYIKLDVATNSTEDDSKIVNVEGNGKLKTGQFTANVVSNKPYNLFISSPENKAVVDLVSDDHAIKVIDGSMANLTSTSWGIRCYSDDCDSKNYRGIPLFSDLNLVTSAPFYSSKTAAAKSTLFEVAVYVGNEVASGTYTADILITAAQI